MSTGLASARSLAEFAFEPADENANLLHSLSSNRLTEQTCSSSSLLSSSTSSLLSSRPHSKKKPKYGGLPKFFLTGRIVRIGKLSDKETVLLTKDGTVQQSSNDGEDSNVANCKNQNVIVDKEQHVNDNNEKTCTSTFNQDSNIIQQDEITETKNNCEQKEQEAVTFHSMHEHFIPRRCTLSFLLHDIVEERVKTAIANKPYAKKQEEEEEEEEEKEENAFDSTISTSNINVGSNITDSIDNVNLNVNGNRNSDEHCINLETEEEVVQKSNEVQRRLQVLNTYKTLLNKEQWAHMFIEFVEREIEVQLAKISLANNEHKKKLKNNESMNSNSKNVSKNGECQEEEQEEEESLLLYKPAPRIPFNMEELKSQIVSFLRDENAVELLLEVPVLDINGNPFIDRTRKIDELKFYIKQHHLTYRLQIDVNGNNNNNDNNDNNNNNDNNDNSSTIVHNSEQSTSATKMPENTSTSSSQIFILTKPYLWPMNELREVLALLHLTHLNSHIRLLRTALTRENENKDDNYEIEEFIGDALMDYMIVFDTFMLKAIVHYVNSYSGHISELHKVKYILAPFTQSDSEHCSEG